MATDPSFEQKHSKSLVYDLWHSYKHQRISCLRFLASTFMDFASVRVFIVWRIIKYDPLDARTSAVKRYHHFIETSDFNKITSLYKYECDRWIYCARWQRTAVADAAAVQSTCSTIHKLSQIEIKQWFIWHILLDLQIYKSMMHGGRLQFNSNIQ